jgi:hypothetical protein
MEMLAGCVSGFSWSHDGRRDKRSLGIVFQQFDERFEVHLFLITNGELMDRVRSDRKREVVRAGGPRLTPMRISKTDFSTS